MFGWLLFLFFGFQRYAPAVRWEKGVRSYTKSNLCSSPRRRVRTFQFHIWLRPSPVVPLGIIGMTLMQANGDNATTAQSTQDKLAHDVTVAVPFLAHGSSYEPKCGDIWRALECSNKCFCLGGFCARSRSPLVFRKSGPRVGCLPDHTSGGDLTAAAGQEHTLLATSRRDLAARSSSNVWRSRSSKGMETRPNCAIQLQ